MSARNLVVLLLVAGACSRDKGTLKKIDTSSSEPTSPAATTPELPSTSDASHSSYVGSRYDPMPSGVSYESGTIILGADGKPSRFVLSHVKTPRASMTWLDEMLPDEGATRRRVVRAAIDDPPLASGERLVIGTCGVGGKFNGDVVAIVKGDGTGRQLVVSRAWRANPTGARFDINSTSGVVCEEPGG